MTSKALSYELEQIKKHCDFVTKLCTDLNKDRLKHMEEIDVLKKIIKRLCKELKSTIQHAKECEKMYNISGDAVIESAEEALKSCKL